MPGLRMLEHGLSHDPAEEDQPVSAHDLPYVLVGVAASDVSPRMMFLPSAGDSRPLRKGAGAGPVRPSITQLISTMSPMPVSVPMAMWSTPTQLVKIKNLHDHL